MRSLGLELGAQPLSLAHGAAHTPLGALGTAGGPAEREQALRGALLRDGGELLVELAPVAGRDAVAPAVCRALGIAAQAGRPALGTLLDALAPQAVARA